MSGHIIITYSAEKAIEGHVDPNFTQLVYGNSGKNGNIMKNNLDVGSYVFFNARIGDKRYITAYFYVEKILLKGKHDNEIENLNCSAKEDNVIVIGSRVFSKVLTVPLELNRKLIGKIKSYNADDNYFDNKESDGIRELEAIKDKTLNPKVITEEEKELLINLCKNRG
ncbi:hypothetical protein [Bacillus infantis]|uniref:hypothetical protein n=1 Tax=Bacillus infantis TaxID=324767 RepID=UPI0021551226|nr:hypothetical protein [Bacillus infantis]MCR6609420.1 hypothetical protein [Bacillus infantis]